MAQHAGYGVAFNFALSSFKVGLDQDEWRSHIDIKREMQDKFDWCEDLSQMRPRMLSTILEINTLEKRTKQVPGL